MYALSLDSFIQNPKACLLPGITRETVDTCSRLLQHNDEHHHVYFDSDFGFHNHASHHLLVALGLGATSKKLEQLYEEQKKLQKPIQSLHDRKDFDPKMCLGDERYYHDYLEFFREELENEKYQGKIEDLIEDYVFNKDYLPLIFGGALHPFIHLGYALEFHSKLMAIEGLAMAAIDAPNVTRVLEHLKYDQREEDGKTSLDIIQLMANDQRFDGKVLYEDKASKTRNLMDRGGGPFVAEYAQMWKCDINDLRRAAILLYAGSIRPKKVVRLDFFLMHATTSSLFLDTFVHSLKKKENQLKLLKAKFAVDLLYFVARGRPKLNLNYLFNEYQPSKEHSYADAQNPWLPLVDQCLTHPDEHVAKTIRALIHAEKFDSADGKEKLPYFKIAQITMDAVFPIGVNNWAFEGVGWDEYWETVEDF